MFSKSTPGGYLRVDHRESPGITPQDAMRGPPGTLPIGKGMVFQSDTRRCGHCPRQIVLNPLRQRERGWCSTCDKYICDDCNAVRAATGDCRPWNKVLDEMIDAAAKGIS